jgi:predicted CXXCH cytochrome family protein
MLSLGPSAQAAGGAQAVPVNPQATSVAQSDQVCAKCHADIYRQYLDTPMANASGAAVDKLLSVKYVHQKSHVEYDISLEKGKAGEGISAWLEVKDDNGTGETTRRPLSYFLGSGHLAVSYLYSVNGYLFESPVAWYAAVKGYDMKPGLGELTHGAPAIPMQSSCLRCHMSSVQPSEAGSLNAHKDLPFLHTGITCEACHGDSEKHVGSNGKAAIVNPAKLKAEQRDSVCISCHLEGDVSVDRAGQSALQYRPGDSISTYVTYYVFGGAELTRRGVSEVEQFAQSHCKLASGDAMPCTSCHDPHASPPAEQKAAFYRAKCLACHSDGVRGAKPDFARQHHPEQKDCTSCHMPRTGAENIPHVAWTDHRILKVPDHAQEKPVVNAELGAIFSPGATKRDLAMGYYKAMIDGNRALEPKAWRLLNEQRDAIAEDKEALDALGILNLQRGQAETAQEYFRRVLALDERDLIALTNLGTLMAKEGDWKGAAVVLRSAFERNPDVAGLAMNLARVECIAGDGAAAREALDRTLVYNPGVGSVKQLRAELGDCKSGSTAAAKR